MFATSTYLSLKFKKCIQICTTCHILIPPTANGSLALSLFSCAQWCLQMTLKTLVFVDSSRTNTVIILLYLVEVRWFSSLTSLTLTAPTVILFGCQKLLTIVKSFEIVSACHLGLLVKNHKQTFSLHQPHIVIRLNQPVGSVVRLVKKRKGIYFSSSMLMVTFSDCGLEWASMLWPVWNCGGTKHYNYFMQTNLANYYFTLILIGGLVCWQNILCMKIQYTLLLNL